MIALTTNKLQNAIARARQLRPTVHFLGERHFKVYSARNHNEYEVRFAVADGVKLGECSCRAGQEGLPCYHLAAAASVNIGVAAMRRTAQVATPRTPGHIYHSAQDTPLSLPEHQHTCPDCGVVEGCTNDLCEPNADGGFAAAQCVDCLTRLDLAA
jgi:hypothetical protein